MTPGDKLNVPGAEYLLCAASIEQARLCFRFIRHNLEPTGLYRFLDSNTRIGIVGPDNTRLRVLSSNGKTAMGIVGCPLLVADEPGSWEVVGGTLMFDAIQTAQGKPNSSMRAIYIGTLAPADAGWWRNLIEDGSHDSIYVQALLLDGRERWDDWREIKRCNPLMAAFPDSRKKLREERKAAYGDSRLKARFLSYRLNCPSKDDSEMLLSVDDFQAMVQRDLPAQINQPIVAVDLGGGRAWSAAVAVWEGGRVEALALAPGLPNIDAQEKRDRVAAGTYQALADAGLLTLADGLRVQKPAQLWDAIRERWGTPVSVICDRFRLADLQDAIGDVCPIEPRVTRWSEAAADVRALRQFAKDGPFTIAEPDRPLLAASLSVCQVKSDDQGNTRIAKGSNNTARDDVGAALALAAGAYWRAENQGVPAGPGYVMVR